MKHCQIGLAPSAYNYVLFYFIPSISITLEELYNGKFKFREIFIPDIKEKVNECLLVSVQQNPGNNNTTK
jgi:hypothetical protein